MGRVSFCQCRPPGVGAGCVRSGGEERMAPAARRSRRQWEQEVRQPVLHPAALVETEADPRVEMVAAQDLTP